MNKIVLVTGASKGIGKSIAETFVQAGGYDVYLVARDEQLLSSVCDEIGANGYFAFDLSKVDDCKNLMDVFYTKVGKIDILVNNAGAYVYSPVETTNYEDFVNIIDLNIKAPYILTQNVVKSMKLSNWGRIINIGSISGVVGEANASLYSMSKSALIGFTKALALELAQNNITVNTIHPGWVETDLANDAVQNSDFSYEEELEMIPQRRFIKPVEIAELVLYIASEKAKGLTGQNINLCAGLSVG